MTNTVPTLAAIAAGLALAGCTVNTAPAAAPAPVVYQQPAAAPQPSTVIVQPPAQ